MSFSEARATLAAHQKTAKGAPPYSRFINRRLGRVLAAGSYVAGLTPDQVTILSGLATGAGLVLIATLEPSVLTAILVVALLVLGYALDSADGQLARLRGGGSKAGEWLDHTFDSAKVVAIHLAVLISLYRFGELDDEWLLLIPIAFAITNTVLFFSWVLRDLLLAGTEVATNAVAGDESPSVVTSLLRALEDYGVLMLVLLLLPNTTAFLIAYGALAAWSAAMTAAAIPRRYLALRRHGAPS